MKEIIPSHVAIIMDGNRRWAKEKGLPGLKGHQAGSQNLKTLAEYAFNRGVKVLSVFAFSTENFKRSADEINHLMDLFANDFLSYLAKFQQEDIKIVISGRQEKLRPDVIATIEKMTSATKNNQKGIFNICLAYGGQQEITDATKNIVSAVINQELAVNDIDEALLSNYLYNDLPPIDLLIRTSGEMRISNFMLWQAAYAEFYFPKCHFPDFNEIELDKAIVAFNGRERKFGGDKK